LQLKAACFFCHPYEIIRVRVFETQSERVQGLDVTAHSRDFLDAKRTEELKAFNAGTPEYNRLEEEIEKAKYEFNIKATKERKEFLDREAKVYYKTYLEVNDAVKVYAQRNNLGMVLRFNGDPVDPNRRECHREIEVSLVGGRDLDVLVERGRAEEPCRLPLAVAELAELEDVVESRIAGSFLEMPPRGFEHLARIRRIWHAAFRSTILWNCLCTGASQWGIGQASLWRPSDSPSLRR
jgi:hypothetical protein